MDNLKKRIMRRIYFLYMVRNFSPLAFDCFLLVVVVFVVTLFVSVKDVLANLAMVQANSLSNFSIAAFADTEIETKLLLVVLGVVGFLAVRDLKRAVRAVRVMRGNGNKDQKPNPTVGDRTEI